MLKRSEIGLEIRIDPITIGINGLNPNNDDLIVQRRQLAQKAQQKLPLTTIEKITLFCATLQTGGYARINRPANGILRIEHSSSVWYTCLRSDAFHEYILNMLTNNEKAEQIEDILANSKQSVLLRKRSKQKK